MHTILGVETSIITSQICPSMSIYICIHSCEHPHNCTCAKHRKLIVCLIMQQVTTLLYAPPLSFILYPLSFILYPLSFVGSKSAHFPSFLNMYVYACVRGWMYAHIYLYITWVGYQYVARTHHIHEKVHMHICMMTHMYVWERWGRGYEYGPGIQMHIHAYTHRYGKGRCRGYQHGPGYHDATPRVYDSSGIVSILDCFSTFSKAWVSLYKTL